MAEEPSDKDVRREEIHRLLEEARRGAPLESEEFEAASPFSSEYETFLEEEREKHAPTLYERACSMAERLNLEPGEDTREDMEAAISFAHLDITPTGAFSLAIASALGLAVLSVVAFFLGFLGLTGTMISLLLSLVALKFFIDYPMTAAQFFRVKAASEIVLAVIYMVIYMRSTPNMEGAVRYAAMNLTGPLAYDFRKLMWDVESGKYSSMKEALDIYMNKWRSNEEFIEAVSLMRTAMEQPEERRHAVLDEAVNVVLNGTREKMESYSQELRLPITLIHTMGIVLPILVLIMFPVMILFLGDVLNPWMLFIFYDVALPIGLYLVIRRVLQGRPVGFSVPDVSLHPKFKPMGKVDIGNRRYPLWPFTLLGTIGLLGVSIFFMLPHYTGIGLPSLVTSLGVIWALGIGMIIHFYIGTSRLLEIREDINEIQEEFGEALFRLGNTLSLGTPLERALEETIQKSPDLSISEMFRQVLDNIRNAQLSFEQALFDRKYGAVWNYPSRLIINVMHIVVESTQKGVRIASRSALSIARYIRQIQTIENDLRNMLSESTTSMRFMSLAMAPLIGGVTVTMAGVMMLIFQQLGASLQGLQGADVPGFSQMLIGGWGQSMNTIPLALFQIVVGIYLLEAIYILSVLQVGVENGPGDTVMIRHTAAWSLLVGLIVYTFSMLISWSIFGTTISGLVSGGAATV